MIRVENLQKIYPTIDGEVRALDDVSLTIRDGEFVAIIGPSGSGKTTLLSLLAGLESPDSGTIQFNGQMLTQLSQDALAALRRREIGVIYQFYNLIPELNVRENITLPVELDGRDVDEAALSQILLLIGMSDRGNAFPNMLSGGRQQRVAIARALFAHPSIILADEPTGNLDAENAAEIIALLRQLHREGITVVVVTHSEAVAHEADRVITISDGKIIGDKQQ